VCVCVCVCVCVTLVNYAYTPKWITLASCRGEARIYCLGAIPRVMVGAVARTYSGGPGQTPGKWVTGQPPEAESNFKIK